MNRSYRIVWSAARGQQVVAPENARCGRRGGVTPTVKRLLAALLIACARPGFALPVDGVIVGGSGAISQTPDTLIVNQSTANLAINWQRFNIGASETVNFVQPGRSAIALNRVLGSDATAIYGKLNANGQVFLVNSNGILFARGAQVNVGGLAASTLDLDPADFMAGKRTFTGSGGRIDNLGTLSAADGGYIALLGGQVSNEGTISAKLGTVALASGNRVSLDFAGDKLLTLQVEQGTLNSLVENRQVIQADGGQVILTARAADQLLSGVVNTTGIVQARGISTDNGVIRLSGDLVVNTGTLDASGSTESSNGGTIDLNGRSLLQAGVVRADGAGRGGHIHLTAEGTLIQTAAGEISANAGSGQGGTVDLSGGHAAFLSGSVSANGQSGGKVSVTAPQLTLSATTISADGSAQGGSVLIGGDAHGANPDIANAQTTIVNPYTTLSAQGRQGKIVVWSDQDTRYYGSAKTGAAGFIEVSGKQNLCYGGQTDAGTGGHALFDPTNLIIDNSAPALFYLDLANPDPAANETHGWAVSGGVVVLSGGNIAVASPNDSFGAANAGAAYLYNGSTGALISALTGSTASDQVGVGGITALSNGNYVVRSSTWKNGAIANAGAATWGSGTTGVSGIVSSANSLVGSTASDQVGSGGITALTNGNYVVRSPNWDNGAIVNAGAATWGNGTTGISGAVSSTNSLVGSTASDQVGNASIIALNNGNYVVSTSNWDNGATVDAGAVTWGNGATGISGAVTSANSLVGSATNDRVGNSGITALTNGNYVVVSANWDKGGISNAGAATWGSGTTGISGAVSSANSLVGSLANDAVGGNGVTALTNGNYVVISSTWKNGATLGAGAVTWGNGTTGISGAVTSANSLVGSSISDQVGIGGVTALTNGNYVVGSYFWNSTGAATWGNGTTGISGAVTSANSLVGSSANDLVGVGVTALANGNYVVNSPFWRNGAIASAGAVTWGNGTTGISGAVTSANSLVGTTANDQVGNAIIKALANGNYLVRSPNWDNGAIVNVGAVTWGNGTTGISGAVTSANSLVGTTANDQVGSAIIKALANGNYVVSSPNWDNGAIVDAGAVTWGNGTTGISGAVSSANSLVGSTANDAVGNNGVTALINGNYVVSSISWNNGAIASVGAATWGNGTTGINGAVTSANSLVGITANDQVGNWGITALANGNYVVNSPYWDKGAIVDAGAVTLGKGTTGISGAVTSANSLVGSTAIDQVGNGGITTLANSNYVVSSPNWDNGAIVDAGAVWLVADPSNLATLVNNSLGSTTLSPTALSSAAIAGSTVTLQASNNLTVNSAVSVAGQLNLIAGNVMTLNAGITSTALGDALQLSALSFVNTVGASALTTPNGRWLVWSGNPASDTRNGLPYAFKQYNANYGVSAVQGSGNGLLYTTAPVISAALTGSVSKVYDATTTATLAGANYTSNGAIDGDSISLNNPASGTYDTRHAAIGGKTVTVTGVAIASTLDGALPVYGYQLASSTINGNVGAITPKALSLSGLTVPASKVYDATTAAVVGGAAALAAAEAPGAGTTADGKAYTGDTVGLSGSATGTYNSKDVATATTVTYSGLSLAGAEATNYSLVTQSPAAATITAKDLSMSGLSVPASKVYDATTAAVIGGAAALAAAEAPGAGTTADGKAYTGDTVGLSGSATGTYNSKDVATATTVTYSGLSLAGAEATNYSLVTQSPAAATITPKDLSMSGLTVPASKVYDATTNAVVGGAAALAAAEAPGAGTTADGKAYTGDTVSLSGTATGTYNSKDVATATTVTYSGLSLAGADAANYSIVIQGPAAATITPRPLTVNYSGVNKAYDGTVAATVTTSDDRLGAEVLTINRSAAFIDPTVGVGKLVNVSGASLSGAGAGNYALASTTGTTSADITGTIATAFPPPTAATEFVSTLSSLSRPPPATIQVCCQSELVGINEFCDPGSNKANPFQTLIIVSGGMALPIDIDSSPR
ncbi:YDG domain-containing protein [Propionivibrio sp.]|uniref:YDG domain-containing protein n=1 Tax=Propionivibrio sp. TaxID=2212460 RepID=UPI002620263B|nr:YDG domain-containing protein [Propionivibrio sp.]